MLPAQESKSWPSSSFFRHNPPVGVDTGYRGNRFPRVGNESKNFEDFVQLHTSNLKGDFKVNIFTAFQKERSTHIVPREARLSFGPNAFILLSAQTNSRGGKDTKNVQLCVCLNSESNF